MNQTIRIAFAFLVTFSAVSLRAAPDRVRLTERLVNAEYVLEEVMANPETAIPAAILQEAKGIVLTLNYQGGFFIGAHAGTGILLAKNPLTNKWTVPAFVKTGGANLGLQLGVKEFDSIYIIMDDDILRRALSGRLDFSADAGAVAGPVYASTESMRSDAYRDAKILVYATKKGLYAGVSVKAGWVAPSKRATKEFYSTDYNVPEIVLSDWFEAPSEATALLQRLNYYTDGGR